MSSWEPRRVEVTAGNAFWFGYWAAIGVLLAAVTVWVLAMVLSFAGAWVWLSPYFEGGVLR